VDAINNNDFAGLLEVARAAKMRRQNTQKQNKFDDVFTTVETGEKEPKNCMELDTLSLARQKRP